eukprot:SAG11_NODE_3083_length_2706_cov_6.647104_4_plen_37_part_00
MRQNVCEITSETVFIRVLQLQLNQEKTIEAGEVEGQ